MRAPPLLSRSSNKAAALIIVLAFVVLVTGVALAYFTRTTTDRQLAQSSYNDTSADLLARSALDIVVGDFKQEIVNGSNPTTLSGTTIYVPNSAANVVPQRNVSVTGAAPSPVPNLIRISLRGDAIVSPAIGSRASDVSSTDPSANGRSISNTRWNKHCLISGDLSTATIDNPVPVSPAPYPTPISGQTPASWDPPDWVIVTRAGPTPFASWNDTLADPSVTNTNYAIGRYAYAVYDEGGLIDITIAGYPTPAATPIFANKTDIGRKAVPTWTDLTALLASPTPSPTPLVVSVGGGTYNLAPWLAKLVGFRNYATTQQSNVSNLNFLGSNDGPVPTTSINSFVNYFLGGNLVDCPPDQGAQGGKRTVPAVGFSPPGRDFIAVNPIPDPNDPNRTDQAFVTRAELLRFFSTTNILPPATSVNILQFLGTFSREQNKPTLPLTPGWPNPVVLQQRFFLGNLNLIQTPTPTPPPGPIQTYFGLQWGPNGRWQYVGQNGTLQPTIQLPDPSGSPAPDFFQILNYAFRAQQPIDKILSLGAAVIDLYDYDYNPPLPNNQVITGVEYDPPPFVAWGAEWWWCGAPMTCPSPSPSAIPMGSPVPLPAPTAIAGYTPYLQTFQVSQPCGEAAQTTYEYPLQTSGELGYAYNPITSDPTTARTLDFKDAPPPIGTNVDAYLLDFFTYNSALVRAGTVSLNTHQAPVLVAILKGAWPTLFAGGSGNPVSLAQANAAAYPIVNETIARPALSRADIARLASVVPTSAPFNNEEGRETFARAFSETTQTRTWGLLIDLVAQTGHYKPNATNLQTDFVVEGEKRYWLHIAIDRFDGTIVGQQLEEVTE
jgi:hypothetical protein